ncbi:cob(I)yrinic acid a,c-diamide adenosyltransferase [soil metagenome]
MARIYTKTGDAGTTGLIGAGRIDKDAPRIAAYGTVDELNAALGVVHASTGLDPETRARIARLQEDLFVVGSALADPDPDGPYHRAVGPNFAASLEQGIDELQATLPPLTCFILPGGTPEAAGVHLARTICRRAEREIVHLQKQPGEHVPNDLLVYLNRLGDFLFVLARAINQRASVADIPWKGL